METVYFTYIENGKGIIPIAGLDINDESWQVGDEIQIWFDCSDVVYNSIKELPFESRPDCEKKHMVSGNKCHTFLEFNVVTVKRRVAILEEDHQLKPLVKSYVIQAVNQHHEDTFKWLTMGVVPNWVVVGDGDDGDDGDDGVTLESSLFAASSYYAVVECVDVLVNAISDDKLTLSEAKSILQNIHQQIEAGEYPDLEAAGYVSE